MTERDPTFISNFFKIQPEVNADVELKLASICGFVNRNPGFRRTNLKPTWGCCQPEAD